MLFFPLNIMLLYFDHLNMKLSKPLLHKSQKYDFLINITKTNHVFLSFQMGIFCKIGPLTCFISRHVKYHNFYVFYR